MWSASGRAADASAGLAGAATRRRQIWQSTQALSVDANRPTGICPDLKTTQTWACLEPPQAILSVQSLDGFVVLQDVSNCSPDRIRDISTNGYNIVPGVRR